MKNIILYLSVSIIMAINATTTKAEEMDRQICLTLLQQSDSTDNPDALTESMAQQCTIFQKKTMDEISRISKLEDLDARKTAADNFNHANKDDYDLYIAMVRTMRNYYREDRLGLDAALLVEEILKTNAKINQMFTAFRSRRPLPIQTNQ